MNEVRLSVVVPAYNEETRIRSTLLKIEEYLSKQSYQSEIIVVDDGSKDRTLEVVKETLTFPCHKILTNPENKGKGYTVRHGLISSQGQVRLFTDADNSTPIEEIEKFWSYFDQGYQVVIGSRALQESVIEIHQAWTRETMGRIFNVFVQLFALPGIKDTQCGFKAFTKAATDIIFPRQTIMRWGFDAELLFIARKHKLLIKEVPIRWLNSPDSRINSLKDSYNMFFELLSIRYKNLRGVYH